MALTEEDFFDEEFFKQFPELAKQVQTVGADMFPVDALSDEQIQQRGLLQDRAQRLSPLEAPAMQGSTAIPGNPYSRDISPVSNAVQQGLVNIINAVRERRLLGDEDDPGVLPQLQQLEEQAEKANQQEESQREFAQRMFGDLASKLFDAERDLQSEAAKQAGRIDIETMRDQSQKEIEEIRATSRENVARIRESLGSNGAGGVPTSVITNFANQGRQAGQTLFKQVEATDELLNDRVALNNFRRQAEQRGEDPDQAVESLRAERDRKHNLAWKMMGIGSKAATEGGLNPDLVSEYEDLLDQITTDSGALDDL